MVPTIDTARSIGISDLQVVCSECGAKFAVPLSSIDLPGDTPLGLIGTLRLIACVECSAPSDVDIRAMGFHPK